MTMKTLTVSESNKIIKQVEQWQEEAYAVRCLKCGGITQLVKRYLGSYQDDAYGIPKLDRVYGMVTQCCNSPEYQTQDEITEQELIEFERII
jgi:hypothetical protein